MSWFDAGEYVINCKNVITIGKYKEGEVFTVIFRCLDDLGFIASFDTEKARNEFFEKVKLFVMQI